MASATPRSKTTRSPDSPRRRTSSRRAAARRPDPRSLDGFAEFCAELVLEDGSRFVLHDFQRTMLGDYFGGTVETLILVSKKNGKSTLMAALALHHLLVTPDAECVIAAASRDQAQILLNQARGFVRRSGLAKYMMVKQREIVRVGTEGRVRVMASDSDTADGVIPTLALVDELHRHKSADLYGVFRDGLGPRNGRMITISTAGDDIDSPLGRMRSAAYAMPAVVRNGPYRYARSADGHYALHEWALEADEDRGDMTVVKQANPAPWQTLEALRRRYESPSTTPWQWARFACGVWLQGEDTAIGPVEWANCGTDDLPAPSGVVRIGVDIGMKVDTTGIVVHWLDDDGVAWLGKCRVLVPPAEKGLALRKQAVLDVIGELAEEFGASTVVIDPETGGEIIAQDIEDDLGLEVVAHSQKPAVMAQAAERLYSAVSEGTLRHPKDDTLTRHVLNAHRKSTEDGRWRFVKENKQSRKVIDALIATAMVHNVAIDESFDTGPLIEVFSS